MAIACIFHTPRRFGRRDATPKQMQAKSKTARAQMRQALLASDSFEISETRLLEPSEALGLGGLDISPEIPEIKPTECGLVSERSMKFPG